MGVFHTFKIVQMVPSRAKQLFIQLFMSANPTGLIETLISSQVFPKSAGQKDSCLIFNPIEPNVPFLTFSGGIEIKHWDKMG